MFWLKHWRRKRAQKRPFPHDWIAILRKNVPYYACLSDADRKELQGHIQVFLAEKRFEGCGGLTMSDEIRVTIAAQACILLLHRKTEYFPEVKSVLVYPRAYVARDERYLADGVVIESDEVLLGQSMESDYVILSWEDVKWGAADIHDGENLVFHEFAHQLDIQSGLSEAVPELQERSSFIAWARILAKEYEALSEAVSRGHETLIDPYGAENPAEFFAVVTECFFEKPVQLKKTHPDLYEQLKLFYQQDPARSREGHHRSE